MNDDYIIKLADIPGQCRVIVFAAIQLAKYGDVIALATGLGGMFVGYILMAAATSLLKS
jgi:Ca2+/Na+ antiporter